MTASATRTADSKSPTWPLVAVDVGNSRIKFGLFEQRPGASTQGLPEPSRTLDLVPQDGKLDELAAWLSPWDTATVGWWIGSVQRTVSSQLVTWLRDRQVTRIALLAAGDLPLVVSLPRPDMVGIDRLLNAVGANRLRSPNTPAVVVDLGTAITVDLVGPQGDFLGGAILPGIGTSARALYEFTDLLPLLDMQALAEPPSPLGTATTEALRSGLYWGAVGGVRELITRLGELAKSTPQIFLAGGTAPAVAALLSKDAIYVPHLTLAGITLTAETSAGR
jgi:type III pantothenate kinase